MGGIMGVQGYTDLSPAYQLDDGYWTHEQFLKQDLNHAI